MDKLCLSVVQGEDTMRKQTEKTLQTKADLIAAFWQLYKEKPINKITVKEVTDTAGYYRSTMYYYFEDVYAILEEIETSVLQDWETSLSEALYDNRALLKNDVQAILKQITPFYQKNGEYIAVLLSPNGDPLFQEKIKSTLRQKIFTLLEIPPHTPEAELIFECISSGILGMFVKWYNDKLPLHLVINVVEIFLQQNIVSPLFRYSTNPLLKQFTY